MCFKTRKCSFFRQIDVSEIVGFREIPDFKHKRVTRRRDSMFSAIRMDADYQYRIDYFGKSRVKKLRSPDTRKITRGFSVCLIIELFSLSTCQFLDTRFTNSLDFLTL